MGNDATIGDAINSFVQEAEKYGKQQGLKKPGFLRGLFEDATGIEHEMHTFLTRRPEGVAERIKGLLTDESAIGKESRPELKQKILKTLQNFDRKQIRQLRSLFEENVLTKEDIQAAIYHAKDTLAKVELASAYLSHANQASWKPKIDKLMATHGGIRKEYLGLQQSDDREIVKNIEEALQEKCKWEKKPNVVMKLITEYKAAPEEIPFEPKETALDVQARIIKKFAESTGINSKTLEDIIKKAYYKEIRDRATKITDKLTVFRNTEFGNPQQWNQEIKLLEGGLLREVYASKTLPEFDTAYKKATKLLNTVIDRVVSYLIDHATTEFGKTEKLEYYATRAHLLEDAEDRAARQKPAK